MRELELRAFGTMDELQKDVLRYQERMSIAQAIDVMKPHLRMGFGTHEVQWALIESEKDYQKIMGLQFTQVMFDLSVMREHHHYCLTRLRGRPSAKN